MNEQSKAHGYRHVAIASHGGGGMLLPQTFGDVVSFSEVMARSQHAIPKHLREVPGACLAVAMQAMRWEMDPFAVASKSYKVNDVIAYEAQLIAAVVHTRAPIKTRPDYSYSGEGQNRRCKVSAVFDDGTERSYETPRIADIKVQNSPLWKADPDQQLGYYAIRSFARRYCPEVILGVYTPDEADSFRGPDNAKDVTPRAPLSERLAASPDGSQSDGFSRSHVVSEIDAASEQSTADQESQGGDSSSLSADAMPAAAEHPPAEAAAGTDNGDGSEGAEAKSDQESAPPPLPDGWQAEYVAVLRRARKVESLKKLAQEFWNNRGGWHQYSHTKDGREASAIFGTFSEYMGDRESLDSQLRELGVL